MISAFVFLAYLIALFAIITDLFRDRDLTGGWQAVGLVALVFAPFITPLIYLIARGQGMAERSHKNLQENSAVGENYIRSVANTSATVPGQ